MKCSQKMAIKVICKEAIDLFTVNGECREVLAFKKARKPHNVVTLYKIQENSQSIYIIFELLWGRPLPRVKVHSSVVIQGKVFFT